MLFHIRTDHVTIAAFSNRCHKEPVRPQLSTPKFSFQIRMLPKQLSCRNAFYNSNQTRRRELWGCAYQIMHVIRVYPHLLKLYAVPLFDFPTDRLEALFPVSVPKNTLAIFYRSHKMIMNLICIVFRFADRSHTLQSYIRSNRAASCAELSS